MIPASSRPKLLALLAALTALVPAAVAAQAVVQPLPGTTVADRLADAVRMLGSNPRDLNALIGAGELSLKLDDLSAAAAFFARADKVDPRNPRVKGGMAAVLVRSERPGEALRFFQQADGLGLDPVRYATDRGLAYDLVGEQERAQRSYRLALKSASDEDTMRRYALSLGISGRETLALRQLDPLVARQDRAAWRARAFILAMNGKADEAERIAATMMPPGSAQGLQPFFARLPTLAPRDRAFAVHFGEVRATNERIADARLVPTFAALGPDPDAAALAAAERPVVLAAVQRTDTRRSKRREKKQKQKLAPGRTEMAAASPAPVQVAALQPPAYAVPAGRPPVTAAASRPVVQPLPVRSQPVVLAAVNGTPATPAPALVAAARPSAASTQAGALTVPPRPVRPLTASEQAALRAAGLSTARLSSTARATVANGAGQPIRTPPVTAPPVVAANIVPRATAVPTPVVTSAAPTPVLAAPAAMPAAVTTPVVTAPALAAAEPPPTVPAPATRASDDSILARIVASLTIPAAELVDEATPAPLSPRAVSASRPRAESATGARVVAEVKAKTERDATARKLVAQTVEAPADTRRKSVAANAADTRATARKGGRGAVAATEVEAPRTGVKGKSRTALADTDADATATKGKKGAAARKGDKTAPAATATATAAGRKAARAEPERIWVQVASGANENDLGKAWSAVKAKAPDQFSGRKGYTASSRATNRVVTGPFKTAAEARSFVNSLAKKGVSAFTFTSDAGQAVAKLPAR